MERALMETIRTLAPVMMATLEKTVMVDYLTNRFLFAGLLESA